ncbi:MAG TPA: methionyl-tRNA formyltransferase [Terriglobia bacterium]|nr:methionyl-tRNA formyltransferase [Terriglobia bacterium]
MDLIFCGTPEFAVPTLQKLVAEKFSVRLVITNPDERAGRGYEVKAPPVKQAAEAAGLAVYQPRKLKDPNTQEYLSQFHPDAIVVVAYGHIIPTWMIEMANLGCFNVHASLLPKYRGAAPIQWAIMRGEEKTGVTTMMIDAGLDTGGILLQCEIGISDDDTTETLSEKLSTTGADLMVETLRGLAANKIQPRPQDHAAATLAPILKKEDGRIEWSQTAAEIARRVRGLSPWPGAFTSFRGATLHIWKARPAVESALPQLDAGAAAAPEGKLMVGCAAHSLLEVNEVQLAGRKRVTARDFLNGARLQPGEKLG